MSLVTLYCHTDAVYEVKWLYISDPQIGGKQFRKDVEDGWCISYKVRGKSRFNNCLFWLLNDSIVRKLLLFD